MMKNVGNTKGITPSDTDKHRFNMIMVTGGAGDVTIRQTGGTIATIPNVPVGAWVPCGNGQSVMATGTTATGILIV